MLRTPAACSSGHEGDLKCSSPRLLLPAVRAQPRMVPGAVAFGSTAPHHRQWASCESGPASTSYAASPTTTGSNHRRHQRAQAPCSAANRHVSGVHLHATARESGSLRRGALHVCQAAYSATGPVDAGTSPEAVTSLRLKAASNAQWSGYGTNPTPQPVLSTNDQLDEWFFTENGQKNWVSGHTNVHSLTASCCQRKYMLCLLAGYSRATL